MKKNPLVSVIIPVYNEEKYLDICLATLSNQSYKNREIIVVDDGSTDESLYICRRYKVKVLRQKHEGPGSARNRGVGSARGELIVLADADMKYDKDYIVNIIKPITEGKGIGTFTKEEFVANPENIWSFCWSINAGLPRERRIPEIYHDTENAFRAILKSYFLKGRGFDPRDGYVDDSSLSRKIKLRAVYAKGAICYHFNPESLSEVFYSARWIGRAIIFKPNLVNLLRYSPINSIRVAVKYLTKGAPAAILLFKLVFDAGMLAGIFLPHRNRAK